MLYASVRLRDPRRRAARAGALRSARLGHWARAGGSKAVKETKAAPFIEDEVRPLRGGSTSSKKRLGVASRVERSAGLLRRCVVGTSGQAKQKHALDYFPKKTESQPPRASVVFV